ncbi:MAG: methylmalonyl-CoA mutase family protein, partial [Methanobacteriota archaeon]
ESGFVAREIHDSAYKMQREIEERRRIVVGVNEFTSEAAPPEPILRVDPSLEARQRARVEDFRRRRDTGRAGAAVARLERAAGTDENLFPYVLAAVKAHATTGEICDAMRRVFGEHVPEAAV